MVEKFIMKLIDKKFKKRRLIIEWIKINPLFLGITLFNRKTLFSFGFELGWYSFVFTYYKKKKN